MGLQSTLSRLAKAIPVIVAYAPVFAEGVRQVTKAVKKPRPAEEAPPAG